VAGVTSLAALRDIAARTALAHRDWTWRDRFGGLTRPDDMDTRHLFYTLRMIWNHAMPEHMAVGRNIRRYVFGPFYTAEYMREAVLRLGAELFSRDDLPTWMLAELDRIRAWLVPRLCQQEPA
jgi:hypothetical protein